MSYKCQVCGKTTATARGMCGHMINSHFRFKEHWQWIESHGISFPKTVSEGSYKALIEVVEKECKIQGRKES